MFILQFLCVASKFELYEYVVMLELEILDGHNVLFISLLVCFTLPLQPSPYVLLSYAQFMLKIPQDGITINHPLTNQRSVG